ncbi:glutathione peroxidase [Parvularcula sp. IMCC14364]|uniref:glutathione peroxidase n=1 Tax=Parvularcula sp. IMCC14364 TaxID=3067902 RepID=UPI002740FAF7|nr:glutathione peroxidase [Parvularcula sp. IMCC14364]
MLRKWIAIMMACVIPVTVGPVSAESESNAYGFSFVSLYGEDMPLAQYEGKVLLLVNTASRCGFTHQYDALQTLWETYQDDGLVVIGIPSNDFGGQEPGSEQEIKKFCEANFGINFPMTEKTVVTGSNAHPFYQWISSQKGAPRWNFHKYLIGRDGHPVEAFTSSVEPMSETLTGAIEALL